MAKKASQQPATAAQLPGSEPEPEFVSTLPPPEEPTPETVVHQVMSSVLTCSIPFIDGPTGYAARRVDMRLTGAQSIKLKGIVVGLQEKEAKLADGRYVVTPAHAIQWLLEQSA